MSDEISQVQTEAPVTPDAPVTPAAAPPAHPGMTIKADSTPKPQKTEDHRHCEICATVVGVGARWCGTECEEKYKLIIKKKKRDAAIFIIAIVAIIALQYIRF